jgi:hypothetical protein
MLLNIKRAVVWIAANHTDHQAGVGVDALTDRKGKQVNTNIDNKVMWRIGSIDLCDNYL